MDGVSILVGLVVGLAVGAGAVFAAMRNRSGGGEAAAAERDRADAEREARSQAEQRLAALQASMAERERAFVEQQRQFEESRRQLVEVFKATGTDVLRANSADFKQMSAEALRPLQEQVVKSELLVRELGQKREGDAKQLSEQLKQIADLQMKASSAAQTLGSALRDTRQRGKWGEVGLRTVVEMSGLKEGVHFDEQKSVDGEDGRVRPDMTVKLPGGRVIPIDSKVPLDAYLDSLQPDLDDARRKELREAHAAALSSHVRSLASKNYAKAVGGDIECTVLYMPLESAFLAAQEAKKDLFMEAMESRVFVACPGTLLPLLRTVAMNWGNADAEKSAREVRELAIELLDRTRTLAKHVGSTGTGLARALEGYNAMVGSLESRFLPALNRVAEIAKVSPVEIEAPIDAIPRKLELPESAAHE